MLGWKNSSSCNTPFKIHFFEKIGYYVKIVTVAFNCFLPSIFKSSDSKKKEKLVHIIKALARANNQLQTSVEKELLNSRCKWEQIDEIQIAFSRMTEDQLRKLCFTVYQIRQAWTYAEAHLDKDDENYQLKVTKHSNTIIRCKIDSRHSSAAQYCDWIQYTMDDTIMFQWLRFRWRRRRSFSFKILQKATN